MIRHLLLGSALALGATAALSQQAGTPMTAEQRTKAAIAKIEELNPRLNAVIAVDPTALDQARGLDRQPPRARAAVRHADPDQGQYRDGRAAADHGGQPGAGEQRHRPRRAAGRAAARARAR